MTLGSKLEVGNWMVIISKYGHIIKYVKRVAGNKNRMTVPVSLR